MGHWGFIDRMFYDMGGKPADRGRLENAWLVDYPDGADHLGKMLSKRLDLKDKDLSQFGTIFDIRELGAAPNSSSGHRHLTPRARRLGTPQS